MKSQLFYVIACAFFVLTNSQYISDKECPTDRPIQQNFNVKRYLAATWYELLRYDMIFEKDCNCGFARYTMEADDSVKVNNCCKRLPDTTPSCSIGKAYVSFPDVDPLEGRFNVTFGGRPASTSNYWVMSTDYEHYAIIYYCRNKDDGTSSQAFWLLSPNRQLDPKVKSTVDNLIDNHFLRDQMITPEQDPAKCGE